MLWLLIGLLGLVPSLATPGFDPSEPAARFTGPETFTADGSIKLWSAIERLEDPDRTLLSADAFGPAVAWPANVDFAPHIRTCFGTATPGAHMALLHMGPAEEVATGTPILLVHGAGDNGSRSWVTLATRLDRAYRPVYALTFAHPHGDVFKQAELIADAIARIRERTGAAQVDVVSHSKGGIATAVYLSNAPGTDWPNAAYEQVGTRYRGDVRRAVFIATPLGGIDTAYRWPNNNLAGLDSDEVLAPTSWSVHYPLTTGNLLVSTELADQDHLADGADWFPGQRQLLARQPAPLPGSNPTLGAYALQQDWYTTYEGGLGFVSSSEGIDAAIDEGGDLIALLPDRGVDPSVELYLLAGDNPLMSNGVDWVDALFGDAFADDIGASVEAWGDFVGDLVGEGLLEQGLSQAEVAGVASGDLVLGEISGPSDGVVFLDSATNASALTARGAVVVETQVVDLSHLDLLYASPVTGDLLIEASEAPDGEAWMASFGQRYKDADTLGWVERVLADPDPVDTDDPGDTGADTDVPGDTDPFDPGPARLGGSCEGCRSVSGTAGLGVLLGGLLQVVLRRRGGGAGPLPAGALDQQPHHAGRQPVELVETPELERRDHLAPAGLHRGHDARGGLIGRERGDPGADPGDAVLGAGVVLEVGGAHLPDDEVGDVHAGPAQIVAHHLGEPPHRPARRAVAGGPGDADHAGRAVDEQHVAAAPGEQPWQERPGDEEARAVGDRGHLVELVGGGLLDGEPPADARIVDDHVRRGGRDQGGQLVHGVSV